MSIEEQWDRLQTLATGYRNVMRGDRLIAYIVTISHSNGPTEYWLAEFDHYLKLTNVKQICLY